MNLQLSGIISALWTPCGKDGNLLVHEYQSNIRFGIDRGVSALLAFGSTGEFPFFSTVQRKEGLECALDAANGLPVVANVSHVNPQRAIELAKHAADQGAAAIAILPPYYYAMSQSDLEAYFVTVGGAADIPVLLYNYPELTGNRISLAVIAGVADKLPIVGIKQSGDEYDYHDALVELGESKGFRVYTGADTRLAETLSKGVAGAVCGLANAVPDLLVNVYKNSAAGEPEKALGDMEKLRAIGSIMKDLEFPANVAATMVGRGLPIGEPKTVSSEASKERFAQVSENFASVFKQWGLVN